MHKKWKGKVPPKSALAREEIRTVVSNYESFSKIDSRTLTDFNQFPLSEQTLKGLEENEFHKPTDIQRNSLQYSLTGSDVIGAAKTGSGKTLALLIPILERLWVKCWSRKVDGLGALVIVPTRELAFQIFQVLNKIGVHHNFSAALIIGGTNVEFEKNRLARINILVCTPGRLLQHMDENEFFNCESLQVLVIDEADRILDLGFEKQINAIIENLPAERQTLLFSATQTKNVKDLARLALRNPIYISVHENATQTTPETLQQSYVVCEDENKLNMLWWFLIINRRKKMMIFVSCCKQARYFTEVLCHLRPGLSLMGLWGTMNQAKRLEVFHKFNRKTSGAAMIATDVASRGLDFAKVDLVVQLDCPADVDDYIHRVGRTARMEAKGEAVLILTKFQEKAMVEKLKGRNIPIRSANFDQKQLFDISGKLQATITQFSNLKEFAQRSFVAYIRSIHIMRHKDVFDVRSVNFQDLARSYGLLMAPRVRFLVREERKKKTASESDAKKEKNIRELIGMLRNTAKPKESIPEVNKTMSWKTETNSDDDDAGNEDAFQKVNTLVTMGGDKNDESQVEIEEAQIKIEIPEESETDDLLKVKRKDIFNVLEVDTNNLKETSDPLCLSDLKKPKKPLTKTAMAKKIMKSGINLSTKKIFNDDDDHDNTVNEIKEEPGLLDISKAKSEMEEISKKDKLSYRAKLKTRRQEKKRKEKEKRKRDDESQGAVLDLGEEFNDQVDLSWLPDPDNPKSFDYEVSGAEAGSENETSHEQKETTHVKRHCLDDSCAKKKKKRRKVEADEKIALTLLGC